MSSPSISLVVRAVKKNWDEVVPGGPQPTQPFKFTVADSCERIKDEFNFLQAQYHSLKVELEKLAQEKTEMQRHYVMVSISAAPGTGGAGTYYEMSYGLNVEMHKQERNLERRGSCSFSTV
ncbi:unnamed protein product [Notodromas monacha]|uniref:Groucho/TLE N-terminal Q-rich domain-containing protein n=1 Tax=Notodromas monacha TaxID=399045 RepID=A0A7R9G9F6_9CRUS|nr:unnamed protein product [Notodromas monacha]CAG0912577.1 unnamed protein product [Notodromas monacha]